MNVIHPDGRIETKEHKSYADIVAAVNPPGRDDPFTAVPIPEGLEAGYTVYANDVGLLIGLPRNLGAELLCSYGPLVGPVCVASYEEAGETDCIGYVTPEAKAAFERRLHALVQSMTQLEDARKSRGAGTAD